MTHRRMARTIAAAALGLLLAAAPARAMNKYAGTSGAQFLKLGAGSRAGAMAEAYSAVVRDVYALYYNPGALTEMTRPQLAASHTEHFADISYEFAGFAYPFGRTNGYSKHVLGLAIYNLSVGDLERRTEDTLDHIGTFGASDYSYNVSYAHRFTKTAGVGATAKFIHQTIDTYDANAIAFDVGAIYRPRPDAKRPIALALVVKNLGSRPSFAGGQSDPLPSGFTVGAGCDVVPKRLKLDLDVTKYRDTDFIFASGAEYVHPFGEEVSAAIRGGATSHYRENDGFSEVTMGAGFNFHKASFDFAWVPFGTLGNTFRYSLLIRF